MMPYLTICSSFLITAAAYLGGGVFCKKNRYRYSKNRCWY